jgi:acyl-CoA dehydrogenase
MDALIDCQSGRANMISLLSIFAVIGLIWTSVFFRLSTFFWATLIGFSLLLLIVFDFLPLSASLIFGMLYIAALSFALFTHTRQQLVITPLLRLLEKRMPNISATERDAIEAGDTWWEKELFSGAPRWSNLFNMPAPLLSQEESNFLNHQVEELCAMINDWEIVHIDHNLPQAVWDYLKKQKFFGMIIPKHYGGLGFSAIAHSTVITKIATRSISTAVTTMVPNSLGPAELLLHYGTEEQKNYYLPRLATGLEIPCFALTGPDAGSDAGAIPDTGIICRGVYSGKEVIGIRLSWDKRYITLAPLTTLLGLAFHLYDPEHLLSDKENVGITLCLIPATHPGVEIGHRHYPMHLAFMNGPTRGKEVFIPLEWIIGGEQMAGKGWKMLMESLSIGRSISLPALSTACAKITFRLTGAYSRIRQQFNTPIASFEGIEESLGYIAGFTYLLDATRMLTAGAIDQHINPSIVSAIAKYQMTEISRQVISHAMDIHAGQMIQIGPRNVLANVYTAMPISITVEGANILTRNLIIFGQGAIRCHPYLLKEIELINAKEKNIQALDQTIMAHFRFFLSNFSRTFAYGLSGGCLIFPGAKNKKIKRLKQQLTRMSAALALLADTSLILLGGSLKRRERLSARLGDILSELYLASCVLKYFYDHQQNSEEIDYVCWCVQTCLAKIQIACDALCVNFPLRWVGKLLSWIIFPWGRAYLPPTDQLHKKIVKTMLEPGPLRDRLTEHYYQSRQEDETGFRLEKALKQLAVIDPLLKKLHLAMKSGDIPEHYDFKKRVESVSQAGLLTLEEANMLIQYESLRNEIIKVNEFSFDLTQVLA